MDIFKLLIRLLKTMVLNMLVVSGELSFRNGATYEFWVVSMQHVNRKKMKFIFIICGVGSRRINVTCSSRAIMVTVTA